MNSSAQLRETMVASQLRTSRVSDAATIKALRVVPRERFVPAERLARAYADEDVPLSPGRVLMQPLLIGRLLDAALVSSGERALVVGAGSGYVPALLAELGAEVTALEEDATLIAAMQAALAASSGAIEVRSGPLTAGVADASPFDLIFINGAVADVPDALVAQLAPAGRLVGVLVEQGIGRGVVGRRSGAGFGVRAFMDAQTSLLPGFTPAPGFRF